MPTIKSKTQFFKELVALKEITDVGQISTVAQKNGLKATNLSKLITALELRLNKKLISRTTKGIYPLADAVKINEVTSEILNLLESVFSEYEDNSKMQGTISIWSEEDYIGTYFLEKVNKFLQDFPQVKVNVCSGDKTNLSQMDIVISSESQLLPNQRMIYTREVNSYFYVSEKYIQIHGRPKNLKDMLENHYLCMRHSDMQQKEITKIIKEAKHLNLSADATSIIFRIVENGDAIGILPDWVGNINAAVTQLKEVPLSFRQNLYVKFNINPYNHVLMNALVQFIDKFVEERDKKKSSI